MKIDYEEKNKFTLFLLKIYVLKKFKIDIEEKNEFRLFLLKIYILKKSKIDIKEKKKQLKLYIIEDFITPIFFLCF